MLLLKDGVRYFPYEYSSEEELEQMVREHITEIFGANSLHFDPQTMKTQIGVTARNDGIILTSDPNQWYILEIELAQHSLRKHIIPQITDFNIAYQQPETRAKLANALHILIRQDPNKTATLQLQKIEDPHRHLTETVENPPTIAIIIDQTKPELEAVCKNLPFKTRATEFKTYTRENAGINVHVHEFEPLYEGPAIPKILLNILTVLDQVYHKGKAYNEAVKISSKRLGLFSGTIRAACTREIGLTTSELRALLQSKEKLRKLLTEKYPDYQSIINEKVR